MRQIKRAKIGNDQGHPPPQISVGDHSLWSLGTASPVCSSNTISSDNHQVMLHSNRMVPSGNGFLSPAGRSIATPSTRMKIRSRACEAWTIHYCTEHNRVKQTAENLRARAELLDNDEERFVQQVQIEEFRSACVNNEV